MNPDFILDIATAISRTAKVWHNRQMKWSDFVERCSKPIRTHETQAQYAKMSHTDQARIKDVGGFVGGYLTGGQRKNGSVLFRSMVTLDLDRNAAGVWDDFTLQYAEAALVYSTHKHSAESPRLRICLPADRPMTPAEYEPVARRWAERIGLNAVDAASFRITQLMYWPSHSCDAPFYFDVQDGEPFNVNEVLATYRNPLDVSEWPMADQEGDQMAHDLKDAEDPLSKGGVIGAFCRCYPMTEAIKTFLAEYYEPTSAPGRYTYRRGSVAGGCVVYDDKFAYSHHDTDPAGHKLCNAFDLVRIHLFGAEDEGSRVTNPTKLPSFLKMQDFAAADSKVGALLARERMESANYDFAGIELPDDTGAPAGDAADAVDPTAWLAELDMDRKGTIKATAKNIITILNNDPKLKGHIYHNDFSGMDEVTGGLPWDKAATRWGNRDDANLRNYLETFYGITGKDKIKDAKDAVLTEHRRHPVREYFAGLEWDGVPRLDTLVPVFLGAEDTPLTRACTRKFFTAAVARVMVPGIKFDYCLVLVGPEGAYKSTLFNIMGGEFFSDSLITTEGKTGMEQLRGNLIIELGELAQIRKADVENVKAYISRREDKFRPAFGPVVEVFPRQCVFCGSTNESYFLRGDTGNRRFWPIRILPELRRSRNVRAELAAIRDQVWAEAIHYYNEGEPLYLSRDLEEQAKQVQQSYNGDYEADTELLSVLEHYLDTLVPATWPQWDLTRRRAFLRLNNPLEEIGTVLRERVCPAEFVCEVLGKDITDNAFIALCRRVHKLFERLGWERVTTSRHCEKLYGVQRSYRRPSDNDGNDL